MSFWWIPSCEEAKLQAGERGWMGTVASGHGLWLRGQEGTSHRLTPRAERREPREAKPGFTPPPALTVTPFARQTQQKTSLGFAPRQLGLLKLKDSRILLVSE